MAICLDEKVSSVCQNGGAEMGGGQLPTRCCKPAHYAKKEKKINIYRIEDHPLYDPVLSL